MTESYVTILPSCYHWWPRAIIFFALYSMIPWHCQTYTSKDIFSIYEPLDETMCMDISLPSPNRYINT